MREPFTAEETHMPELKRRRKSPINRNSTTFQCNHDMHIREFSADACYCVTVAMVVKYSYFDTIIWKEARLAVKVTHHRLKVLTIITLLIGLVVGDWHRNASLTSFQHC